MQGSACQTEAAAFALQLRAHTAELLAFYRTIAQEQLIAEGYTVPAH